MFWVVLSAGGVALQTWFIRNCLWAKMPCSLIIKVKLNIRRLKGNLTCATVSR